MAVQDTVADHLKLMGDRFAIFSSAITEVTGVNSTLEELIANDSVLFEGFGDPNDPVVKFEMENFKQAVRELVISSKGVRSTIKSIAKYASNADHIQRITENLNVPQQDETSGQKLKSYLTVISQRVSNCRKHVEKIQPMYIKVHDLVLQHKHPPLEPATAFTVLQFVRRMFRIGACTVGVTALALLCPILIKYIPYVALSDAEPQQATRPPDPSPLPVHNIIREDTPYYVWNPGRKSASLQMYILGILCLGCGIVGLGCFFLRRSFRSRRQIEERKLTQPLIPPPTIVVTLQSAGVAVSTFLPKLESFKGELLDLEQCVEKAVNCDDSGSISEIEEQLQKLQVNMEAVMTIASDVA